MKNILLLLLALNISCKSNGQEKEKPLKNYQQVSKVIENVLPEREKNSFNRIYNTYYTIEKDTVLLITEEHKKRNREKSDTIIEVSVMKKKINISKKSSLILFQEGYIFLFEKRGNKYILLDEIKDEDETFYDDLGEAHETYFPTKDIEHYRNNEYIIRYSDEGGFKIGIFEVTETGIVKKFLSKGCLIYDEWSEFTFYKIKEERIFVNYLKVWDGEEIGQIELKYENGEYSLNKDQCRE